MTPEERAAAVYNNSTGPINVTRYACNSLQAEIAAAVYEAEAAIKERYRPLVESASAYVEYEISDDPETAHGAIKPMCDALAAIRALE